MCGWRRGGGWGSRLKRVGWTSFKGFSTKSTSFKLGIQIQLLPNSSGSRPRGEEVSSNGKVHVLKTSTAQGFKVASNMASG